MKKVSIIVPVYNSEKTIEKCIDSVLYCTCKDLEILIVDDGSTDHTAEIVSALAQSDDRVQYIYKDNGGVSSARNTGIKQANGEYIMFLDSDDSYSENMCEKLVSNLEDNQSDISICGYYEIYKEMSIERICPVSEVLTSREEIFNNLIYLLSFSGENIFMGSVCLACFKKEIIERYNLRFDSKVHHGEDTLFLCQYLLKCRKVSFVPEALYFYQLGDSSVTKKYTPFLEENYNQIKLTWEKTLQNENLELTEDMKGNAELAQLFSLIINETRSGNPNSFIRKITYIIMASRNSHNKIKGLEPHSRTMWIKKVIALHPFLCVVFFCVRRVQCLLGVYY